jgi:SET domain-containing protein
MHIEYIDDTVGFGVFADRTLRPGEFLGEYAGVVRYKNEMPNGLYGYTYPPLDDGRSPVLLSIDATLRGNICRFINHTTDEPIHHDYDFFNGHWHVTFHVLRPIREGEQLLIDYGAGYWEDKAVPPLELLPRMNEDPSMTSCLSTMSCRPV